jgi:methionine sulfoxide reductase catalytic subunit
MLIKKPADIASSEITPKNVYLNRRSFLVGAAATGAAAVAGLSLYNRLSLPVTTQANAKIDGIQKSKFSTSERYAQPRAKSYFAGRKRLSRLKRGQRIEPVEAGTLRISPIATAE